MGTDLWQAEFLVAREGALRVGDVGADEVASARDENDGCARGRGHEGREARRDAVAEDVRRDLVDVADLDERVLGVDKGPELPTRRTRQL